MAQFVYPPIRIYPASGGGGGATEATQLDVLAAIQGLPDQMQLRVVDEIDDGTGPLMDTSSNNIPSSGDAPQEVVNSLAADVYKIQSVEDIGEFIGVYQGPFESETLVGILPLGGGELECFIAMGSRVSLRNMKAAVISSGFIALNFLGRA